MMKFKACHLSSDRVWKKQRRFSVGKCINYVENKLDYAGKFQPMTNLIKMPSECTKKIANKKHFKVLPTI